MVKIVAFSDTHNCHKSVVLPECDIAIFAGDESSLGYKHEVDSFMRWYNKQSQCKHKIWIAGNHTRSFDKKYEKEYPGSEKWISDLFKECTNLTYLEESSVELCGLKIWGSPITPWFYGDYWAFNKQRDEIDEVWKTIPMDTDIIVTHGPCQYILDRAPDGEYVGCKKLRYRVEEIRPKYHICGHIHCGYGIEEHIHTTYINASICNEAYQPVNKPIVINI